MKKLDIILTFIIVYIFYWYFNIKSKTKCITFLPKCDDYKCIKQLFI